MPIVVTMPPVSTLMEVTYVRVLKAILETATIAHVST